ncbi:MAG: N-acetylneuraminate synthase family protein [Planctomyces sp.]|nr:N-acetylneuraminate synthase family protein [Planctomyces sp.]
MSTTATPRSARKAPRETLAEGYAKLPPDHTYVMAEAGNNHNGSVELAKEMVDVAVECGADAIKLQKRDVPSMQTTEFLDRPFSVPGAEEWGDTYRKVREHIELDADQMAELRDYCKGRIDFVCTPFDIPSVRVLEDIGVDAYKVAAFTVTDLPVLEELSRTSKTIIMSAGMVTEDELRRALEILRNNDLILLHCISCYPMKPEDANLRLIEWLKKFGRPVGWSDHEVGISLAPIAVALGARVIEKHYTLNRALPGFDHAMSLEPAGLKKCIRDIRKVEAAMKGLSSHREVLPCELKCFDQKRPTVCSTRAIRRGEMFTRDMLTTKAPNRGLAPRFIPEIVGKEAMEDIPADTHITFSMVRL